MDLTVYFQWAFSQVSFYPNVLTRYGHNSLVSVDIHVGCIIPQRLNEVKFYSLVSVVIFSGTFFPNLLP